MLIGHTPGKQHLHVFWYEIERPVEPKFIGRFDWRQFRKLSCRLQRLVRRPGGIPTNPTSIIMNMKRLLQPALRSLAAAAPMMLIPAPAQAGAWSTVSDWGGEAAGQLRLIRDQGRTELYLSGYARHGRNTYARDKLDELNENAWGAGVGRRLRNARGNDDILYAMGISDSHCKP